MLFVKECRLLSFPGAHHTACKGPALFSQHIPESLTLQRAGLCQGASTPCWLSPGEQAGCNSDPHSHGPGSHPEANRLRDAKTYSVRFPFGINSALDLEELERAQSR